MIDYTRYQTIAVDVRDKVAVVTFNRPERLNAFDLAMHVEVEDVLLDLDKDGEINAIVVTGAGRAFSAGGNIKAMQARLENPEVPREAMKNAHRLIANILDLQKPIVAAVNGDAVGLGATLALFCDVIFVSENAKIGDPHVRVGVVAGDGGCVIWPLLIGPLRAKRYLLAGDLIDAPEAERIGLVNRVLPPGSVLPEAIAFARRLAHGPTQATNGTKASVNLYLKQAVNLILPTSVALECLTALSRDHAEAVNAFVEKRSPHFVGD